MGESCFPYKSIQQASSTSLFPLSPVALHPSSKSVPRTHSLDCHFHIHTLPANKWSHYQQTHSVIICRRFDIYSIACCQTYEKNMDYSKADDTMKQYIWMCGSALLRFYRFGANESLFIHRKYLHMVAQIDFIICTNTHTHTELVARLISNQTCQYHQSHSVCDVWSIDRHLQYPKFITI